MRAFKQVLTLLISVRAPTVFLVDDRSALEEKVRQFTRLMAREGIIDWEFAAQLNDTPIKFLAHRAAYAAAFSVKTKPPMPFASRMMEHWA